MSSINSAAQDVFRELELMLGDGEKASRDLYGTIALAADGSATIMVDGSADYAPCTCLVGVHHADRVMAHIVNHRIVVFANVTVPSVNDVEYSHVKNIAEAADELLDGVAQAAAAADKTVAEILTNADTASELVDGMQEAATTAGTTLAQIVADADSAAGTLEEMQTAATAAHTTLTGIYQDASDAKNAASAATSAANDALVQVATVEDVLGAVNWITEHGTYALTTDTAVDPDKVYYTRSGSGTTQDPYIYTAVPEPTASGLPGYYELSIDTALSQFVASHLALTPAGLYVLKDGSGYKVLLSNTGMSVIDGSGHVVVTYGESITFDDDRLYSIGNEDAYITFVPATATEDAQVIIGGNVLLGSDKTLSELMAEVDGTIVFKVSEDYSQDGASATLTAHVYQGGEDIASQYPGSAFAWYRKSEDGAPLVPLGNGRTITVLRSTVGYGAAIVCRFTPPNDSLLLDSDDDTLTDSQDAPLAVRTPSGDYVRVADLEATTTVFDTDRLLLVGSEDEKLVSIATLKDVFGDGDYERLDNKPSIEGVELSGDKTFQELGIFQTDGQGYDVPDDYTLSTLDINALWANAQPIGA